MNPRYDAVASRAFHRCEYCHAPEVAFNLQFEVEHIVPPGRGGSSELDNLALACRSCNLFKSDQLEALDPHSGALVLPFHPRRDRWSDHIRVHESGELEGLSATGRATIAQLRMNASVQATARSFWLQVGIYQS